MDTVSPNSLPIKTGTLSFNQVAIPLILILSVSIILEVSKSIPKNANVLLIAVDIVLITLLNVSDTNPNNSSYESVPKNAIDEIAFCNASLISPLIMMYAIVKMPCNFVTCSPI